MRSTRIFTSADLDEIGCNRFDPDEGPTLAAQLVDAVDQGQLVDESDTTFALLLAAELTERSGDLATSLALVDRVIEVDRRRGKSDFRFPSVYRAALLLRLGRDDEAMAELEPLRAQLASDAAVVSDVAEAFDMGGRPEIAEEWLTAELVAVLRRRAQAGSPGHSTGAGEHFPGPTGLGYLSQDPEEEALCALAQYRHRVRRELNLPHDDYDELAESLGDWWDIPFTADDEPDRATDPLVPPGNETSETRETREAQELGRTPGPYLSAGRRRDDILGTALVPPGRPLTVEAYAARGENERYRLELQDGNLVVSPSPTPDELIVLRKLLVQLDQQLPPGLQVLPAIDVDLELAPCGSPGFVRRPDLIVVPDAPVERVRRDGGLLCGCELLVIVEIAAPGAHRTSHVIKRGEYADAGIPHYWIVDLGDAVTLTACQLAGRLGYQDPGPVTGQFVTTEPFPLTLRLDGLLLS